MSSNDPANKRLNKTKPTSIDHREFRWYLVSLAAFMLPQSVHTVVFSWLITIYLNESGDRVGIAQMTSMLPGLLFVLIAGVLAERRDLRQLLLQIHLLTAIPYAVAAVLLMTGQLTYLAALGYALAIGVANAFSQPTRDAMVAALAGREIQRAVTISVGAMFGLQLIGFALAAATPVIGPAPLLAIAGLMVAAGGAAVARLAPVPPVNNDRPARMRNVLETLLLVLRSDRMAPGFFLIFSLGLFFGGAYMVAIPLYLREIYGADATAIAGAFAAFMVGTVISTVILIRRGGTRRPGRALLLALLSGSISLLPLAFAPPMWVFFAALVAWGMGGGVAMSMSRTLMQEAAPAEYRARVMSVFSLGNLGGVPVGALMMGYVTRSFGPTGAILAAAAGVAAMVSVFLLATRLWSVTSNSSTEPVEESAANSA